MQYFLNTAPLEIEGHFAEKKFFTLVQLQGSACRDYVFKERKTVKFITRLTSLTIALIIIFSGIGLFNCSFAAGRAITVTSGKTTKNSISFSWTINSPGSTKYTIKRNGTIIRKGALKGGKASGKLTDARLKAGTTYTYKLEAYDAEGKAKSSYQITPPTLGDGYKRVTRFNNRYYKLYRQDEGVYRRTKFANELPMKGSIQANGCGPTSIAIVMSGYGYKLNPGQVGTGLAATAKKLKSKKVTRNAVFARYLREKGFKVTCHANPQSTAKTQAQMKQALRNKKQVVFWVGGKNKKDWKRFTGSGYHYISVLGINDKGDKVYVGNPNGRNTGWNSISSVSRACHYYRGWIEISK